MRTDLALHYHVRQRQPGVFAELDEYTFRLWRAACAQATQLAHELARDGCTVTGREGSYTATCESETLLVKVEACYERPCLKDVDSSERWWTEDPETGELHMPNWKPPVRQRQRRRDAGGKHAERLRLAAYCETVDGQKQRRFELAATSQSVGIAELRNIAQQNGLVARQIMRIANGQEFTIYVG
jgi:hypothetical protein